MVLKLRPPVKPTQRKNAPAPILCTESGSDSFNLLHLILMQLANDCTLIWTRVLGSATSFAIWLHPRNDQWFATCKAGGNAREAAPVHFKNALGPMDAMDAPRLIAGSKVHP